MSALDLIFLAAAAASSPATDCRTITDPGARLACYDEREARPAAAPAPIASQPSVPLGSAPTQQSAAPVAMSEQASREGRIAAIAPLRRGLFRITLADGRAFDTATNEDLPPEVGTSIRLRRSVIGTTFLDASGFSPITVRPVRQNR